MPDPSSVAERLRPLHPPPPDGIAEAAIMALLGCVLATAAALLWRYLQARRRPLRRAALASLAASRALPAPDRLAAQARLLRNLACALDGDAHALHGDAWLAHLDAILDTRLFSEGPGRAFGDALYRRRDDDPAEALDRELARLLARLAR